MTESPSPEKSRRGLAGIIVLALLVGLAAGYALAPDSKPMKSETPKVAEKPMSAEEGVIWTCSMHPQIRLPHPGRCPICGMELIPVEKLHKEQEGGSLRRITLSPVARKLAEVQVQPVMRMAVARETRMVGKVDYDETRLGAITAWVPGRIDKLFVDYTGAKVKKGQPMAVMYSPDLFTAQAELIEAVKAKKNLAASSPSYVREAAARTEEAAKEKLRLLGLPAAQIEAMAKSAKPSREVALHAPTGGIVIEKNVTEGLYVKTGAPLFTIADLSHVWVVLDAYESDLPWVGLGDTVDFTAEALPGRTFTGRVVYIDPMVNNRTRTVRVRLDVPNPDLALKPGMFVRAVYRSPLETGKDQSPPLVIPATAPLITGRRAVVYVEVPEEPGTYEGREIVLGPRAGDHYVVEAGLAEGERVVTHGNFKIDSAVQIMAEPSMMNPEGGAMGGMHMGGMHMGGMKMGGGKDKSKSMASMDMEVPVAFTHALHGLAGAFDQVAGAGDEASVREACASFLHTLHGVDASSLTGHTSAMWNELSMLLRDDAVLARDADNAADRAAAVQSMKHHFMRLSQTFGLGHGTPAMDIQGAENAPAMDMSAGQKAHAAPDTGMSDMSGHQH